MFLDRLALAAANGGNPRFAILHGDNPDFFRIEEIDQVRAVAGNQ